MATITMMMAVTVSPARAGSGLPVLGALILFDRLARARRERPLVTVDAPIGVFSRASTGSG
jgi:hypothetical protein